MSRLKLHRERHMVSRIGWLRASVLGANDGVVSTASLIIGVAAASQSRSAILTAGIAGLVAGAMSMAAGEYVSVSSQADAEGADLRREKAELEADPAAELDELTSIYAKRGLTPLLARQVAEQLSAGDTLSAHARDELGLSDALAARPIQAALVSAATFAGGAILPLAAALLTSPQQAPVAVSLSSLASLALLGAIGARAGGAPVLKGTVRVTFWGAAAMALTYAVGSLFGAVV